MLQPQQQNTHSLHFYNFSFSLKLSNFSLHFLLLLHPHLPFSTTTITKPSLLSPSKITSFGLWRQNLNTTTFILTRTQKLSSLRSKLLLSPPLEESSSPSFSPSRRCHTHPQVVIFTSSFCYSRKLATWLSPWPRTSSENLKKLHAFLKQKFLFLAKFVS